MMNLEIINLALELAQLGLLLVIGYFSFDSWRLSRSMGRQLNQLQQMLAHGVNVIVEHAVTGETPNEKRTRH